MMPDVVLGGFMRMMRCMNAMRMSGMSMSGMGMMPGFLVMARTIDSVATESDSLVLQRHGDEWFVSEMVVGSVGEEFSFAAPETHPITARKKGAGTDKIASLSQP